ncbi:MAG: DUF3631 domain-containing protein [Alphaproteobacteria bacterium]|nr:DUF3631 domain-containing protein [Alphaproteobacteria bacterium]
MSEIALKEARRAPRAPMGGDGGGEVEAAVKRLAALSAFDYDRVRSAEAEKLGVRVTTLDSAVERGRGPVSSDVARQGAVLKLALPEPWPSPVDGAVLIEALEATFARYLSLTEGAAPALALWTLHTYVFERFAITPRLAVLSAEKGSGKTTCLRLLQNLTAKPLLAAHITPAAMFRTLAMVRPTLLIDEGDTFISGNDELRGVINSGHGSDGALIRAVGEDFEPREFSTWAPLAIASIGELPDTVMDRSVIIPMHRRRADERVERFRLDRVEELRVLARKCARWAQDMGTRIGASDPPCPSWMSDRAADNWRVLLAIAEAAGGEAFARAVVAARKLTPVGGAAPSVGTALLEDIKRAFEEKGVARVTSADLVAALVVREERPWPEWKNGQALSVRELARLLAPFGVKPEQGWDSGRNVRGYTLSQFDDAFARYLPAVSARPLEPGDDAGLGVRSSAMGDRDLADGNGRDASKAAGSHGLADARLMTAAERLRGRVKPGITDEPELGYRNLKFTLLNEDT